MKHTYWKERGKGLLGAQIMCAQVADSELSFLSAVRAMQEHGHSNAKKNWKAAMPNKDFRRLATIMHGRLKSFYRNWLSQRHLNPLIYH